MSRTASPRDESAGRAETAGEDTLSERRPRRVSAAALLCGVQGVVVAALGGVMLLLLAFGDPDDVTQAATGAVMVLLLAALPLAAGHGLWRLRRWSRGPAVITQLLALPTAGPMAGAGGLWPLGAAALALTALAVLGCLVNPTASEALGVGAREGVPPARGGSGR
ncbi:hypothetical protein ACTWP5_27015 [Streptomyces sp. 4N509B]|uniref:hypothetical protein n=1 Tax=Streptomyces sp. 4N509B TaxID=3457413 RepID=UPI003FD3121E